MEKANMRQQTEYGSFSCAVLQLKMPSFASIDFAMEPLKMLQVYRIPRARLMPVPANVTIHPLFFTACVILPPFVYELLLPSIGSINKYTKITRTLIFLRLSFINIHAIYKGMPPMR
jgi:hypothetical protein